MFMCTVTGPGILQWAVESINQLNDNPIEFHVEDIPGVKEVPYQLIQNVTLVSVEQNSTYPVLGNLTSRITVLITPTTLEKHVNCSDGQSESALGESWLIMTACKFM